MPPVVAPLRRVGVEENLVAKARIQVGSLIAGAGLLFGSAGILALAGPAGAASSNGNHHGTAGVRAAAGATRLPATAPAHGPTLGIFAGNGTGDPPTPGPATHSTSGSNEFGIAFDHAGNSYIEDDLSNHDYVYKITPAGILSIFAGNGTDTDVPTPGPATHSTIGRPEGLGFDSADNLYIADGDHGRAYKVTPGGVLSVFAGNGLDDVVTAGPALSEPIGSQDGLAVDSANNVYLVSYEHSQVYKVTPHGSLSILAGDGIDTTPTPGRATASSLGFPEGLAVDANGNVYVADDDNSYVYKVTPGGTLSIFAGNGTDTTPTPGKATATSVGVPENVAVDAAGNVFITDDDNDLVYKVTAAGRLSVIAGITGSDAKGTPGPASKSAVGVPEAIGVNTADDLFVGDTENFFVYKITQFTTDAGYWMAAGDGGVFAFGDAAFHGSLGDVHLNAPIVAMATDPVTGGYWLVAADGGIFAFDAPFYGSTGNVHLNQPIVAMAAAPDGQGYWLVAKDGGIFTFGPGAAFHGSLGAVQLNSPILGMTTDPVTGGYWLVAGDGGIFAFDAPYYGSTGNVHLNQPIVAMAAVPNQQGYWLAAKDGGIFSFGPGAAFHGSLGDIQLTKPIIDMGATPDGLGYLLAASDGGVFDFGDATFHGSLGAVHLTQPVVAFSTSS